MKVRLIWKVSEFNDDFELATGSTFHTEVVEVADRRVSRVETLELVGFEMVEHPAPYTKPEELRRTAKG